MNLLTLFNKLKQPLLHRLWPRNQFVYVAIGDSTIEGYGASHPDKSFAPLVYRLIKRHKKSSKYFNLGKGGARVKDVINSQLQQTIDLNPDLILISIGGNDILYRTPLKNFTTGYQELIETLSQKTDALIIINNIPDLKLAPAIPKVAIPYCDIQVRRFNKIIKKLSDENGAVLIDTFSQGSLFKDYKEMVSDDGLHPSDIGYAMWANTIMTRIYPHITKKSLSQKLRHPIFRFFHPIRHKISLNNLP